MTTETVPVEIKSWLTGEVIYTAAVDVSIAGVFCMRAAVEIAVKARADLSGADLSGANLSGAKIIALIARAIRSDGYEFIAWHTDKGVIIIAGCQRMEGTDAYRQHAKTYASRPNGEALAAETLAILDFIDARTRQVVPAVAVASRAAICFRYRELWASGTDWIVRWSCENGYTRSAALHHTEIAAVALANFLRETGRTHVSVTRADWEDGQGLQPEGGR